MTKHETHKKEPLAHISKRMDIKEWQAWLIRIGAFAIALIVCGIVSSILKPGSFGKFYAYLFKGVFGTSRRIWLLLQNIAMLLCVALAVTPAFKMKFWNIGAEGQVLMGALMCALCMFYMGGKASNGVIVLVCFIASMAMGAIWAVIPALFKAQWNTNETLFTLMMNYVAMNLVRFCVNKWSTNGSGVLGILPYGHMPVIGKYTYLLNIIIVAVLTVLLWVYLRFSKHGYELTVVGESTNTARYIGINIKKVIIRTMILSGVICGIAGFLLVSGTNYTVNANLADGRGFTAILVSWLAHFNPAAMVLTSSLVVFLDQGAKFAGDSFRLGGSFSDIITGIFFFFIIASEFFINYKVKFRAIGKKKEKALTEAVAAVAVETTEEEVK